MVGKETPYQLQEGPLSSRLAYLILSSIIYHMSMFLLSKMTIEMMEKIRRRFFWQGGKLKRKYHLMRWKKICKAKKKGGLGIKNMRIMNISMMFK
jgi:hypothetical protein